MLVQDKTQEIDKTTTVTPESPTPTAVAADVPEAVRPAHRRWRWASAVAGVGALIGVVSIIAFTQSDQDIADLNGVSDGSFEVAEANRFETLRDLATGP
jgi:hypothetical protein